MIFMGSKISARPSDSSTLPQSIVRPSDGELFMSMDLTQQLRAWYSGDRSDEKRLFDEIYPVLRGIAHRQLRANKAGALTLQATELAHEGFMRLFGQQATDWQTRAQFFALAATIVRRVVIDYLRERSALKRGANVEKVSLAVLTDSDSPALADATEEWIALDQVLAELEGFDAASAKVVELRYFVGMTVAEIAQLQEISASTVERQWRTARAWLYQRMKAQ
jgi:RNA polymerase sigma factor (TIGR02999 family)